MLWLICQSYGLSTEGSQVSILAYSRKSEKSFLLILIGCFGNYDIYLKEFAILLFFFFIFDDFAFGMSWEYAYNFKFYVVRIFEADRDFWLLYFLFSFCFDIEYDFCFDESLTFEAELDLHFLFSMLPMYFYSLLSNA